MSGFLSWESKGGTPAEFYRFTRGSTELGEWTSGSIARGIDIPAEIAGDGAGGGRYFVPVPIKREVIETSGERSQGGLRVVLPSDNDQTNAVVDQFRGATPTAAITFCLYRVHQGSAEVARLFNGDVVGAEFSDSTCTLIIEPKQGALKQRLCRQLFSGPCNNQLYDSACGVVKANFSAAATVTAIATDNLTLTIPDAASQTDGYYGAGGLLQFGSRFGFIVEHTGSTIRLLRPVAGLSASSSVVISAGCDRQISTCQAKFNNVANHMGFPLIPSVDPFGPGGVN